MERPPASFDDVPFRDIAPDATGPRPLIQPRDGAHALDFFAAAVVANEWGAQLARTQPDMPQAEVQRQSIERLHTIMAERDKPDAENTLGPHAAIPVLLGERLTFTETPAPSNPRGFPPPNDGEDDPKRLCCGTGLDVAERIRARRDAADRPEPFVVTPHGYMFGVRRENKEAGDAASALEAVKADLRVLSNRFALLESILEDVKMYTKLAGPVTEDLQSRLEVMETEMKALRDAVNRKQ